MNFRPFWLFLAQLPVTAILAQNLVPNWSFEARSACPTYWGQVDLCINWNKSLNNNDPAHHTDYLDSCGVPNMDVPDNIWGYQVPATGSSYMAQVTMAPSVGPDYRENIYAPLLSPLQIGGTYEVNISLSFTDVCQNATNNYGAKFATVPNFPIDGTCQVLNSAIVTDKVNWTTFTGTFIADSAYTYVCIGNFLPDGTTVTVNACPSCSSPNYCYYVDDVCVIEIGKAGQAICEVEYDPTTGIDDLPFIANSAYVSGGRLYIHLPGYSPAKVDVELLDISGRTVLRSSQKSSSHTLDIPVGSLGQGTYTVRLNDGTRSCITRFVVTP